MRAFFFLFFFLFGADASFAEVASTLCWAVEEDSTHCEVALQFEDRFELLREKHGIKATDFEASLSALGKRAKSAARSRSFFIETQDHSFILKSISMDEWETLWQISDRYFNYWKVNPLSRIVPFYRVYVVKGKTLHFVLVMPNLVSDPAGVTRLYDLKGREKRPWKIRHDGVIDDDSLPENPAFQITHKTRSLLLRDIAFLRREGIMDYSLFAVQQGEIPAEVHIIDYLTQYVRKKRSVARTFGEIFLDQDQLSIVRPVLYSDRLRAMIDRFHFGWHQMHGCCSDDE